MDQNEYEGSLEFRICREFSGMSDKSLHALWCDGVVLEHFRVDDPIPRIQGYAWICKGDEQEAWWLEILLPRRIPSRAEIPWEELLPADNVTKWLSMDRSKKLVQIAPAAAIPDLG